MDQLSPSESSKASSLGYWPDVTTPMSSASSQVSPSSASLVERSDSIDDSVGDVYDDRFTVVLPGPNADDVLPLMLEHENIQDCIPMPVSIYSQATILKQEYLTYLSRSAQETHTSAVTTSTELIAGFLQFSLGAGATAHAVALFLLKYFAFKHIGTNDIHGVVSALPVSNKAKSGILGAYFTARNTLCPFIKQETPALFRAAKSGTVNLCALFGGQGLNTSLLDEIRMLNDAYGIFLEPLFVTLCGNLRDWSLQSQRSTNRDVTEIHVTRWLEDEQSCPPDLSAPAISFPIIGLVQLCAYASICHVLGLTPEQFACHFQAFAGHSQGLIVAATISASRSWDDYHANSAIALKLLHSIGLRAQQNFPPLSIDDSVTTDSIANGEGQPSWMLSVRHLPRNRLQQAMDDLNSHLSQRCHVKLALINGPEIFVVAGPPHSLYALNKKLRPWKGSLSASQSQIPHSKRKIAFSTTYLPIGAPFHSPYMEPVLGQVLSDVEGLELLGSSLQRPVYGGSGSQQVQSISGNLLPSLARMVTCEPVEWEEATTFSGCTHMLDFGPGRHLGIGNLVADNKRGQGVRVIGAGSLHKSTLEMGSASDVFNSRDSSILAAQNWRAEFSPKLVRTTSQQTFIDTRLSRLLGLPPLIVAGMTPTTTHWDFVSATISAGYHTELAGGGYHDEATMEAALRQIVENIPPRRGISVNLLYLNPRAMAWQIPLIRRLRSEGINIDGMTIGGGVPEPEVVADYIELGIRHLSFKPGSEEAIDAVLRIADAFPRFPVIIQWTGGRGGGHHSNEDFHRPILRSYARVRRRANTILVAGSGFGADDGSDAFPYLTGSWSESLGFAPMPFDGVLYGSRMMVVQEAHTALAAKEAIAAASGIQDSRWEETMSKSSGTGSIISITSEMGQPMHTLATRGMRFWAELDREIFSLEREQQLKTLLVRKDSLIQRLNRDFQKVWFGVNDGRPVNLNDMTYAQVADRLLQLMFRRPSDTRSARWIHPSWQVMFSRFLQRTQTRFFGCKESVSAQAGDWSSTVETDPHASLASFLQLYPQATLHLISEEDIDSFLILCQQPGQKPVPFIPTLDVNFQTYFKKDSLWQSEDLDALVDGDVERTCILHGPVAASHSNTSNINRPVAQVLGEINLSLINKLTAHAYAGDMSSIPSIEYFGAESYHGSNNTSVPLGVISKPADDGQIYYIPPNPDMELPHLESWMRLLAGPSLSWRYAAVMTERVVQGSRVCANPIKRVLVPRHGYWYKVKSPGSTELEQISVTDAQRRLVATICLQKSSKTLIAVDLFHHLTKTQKPACLRLEFEFDPSSGFAPLGEILKGRNQRIRDFYRHLWLGETTPCDSSPGDVLSKEYTGEQMQVTRELISSFVDATGGLRTTPSVSDDETLAPIDIAILLGWTALVKPLLSGAFDTDLSRLIHLSNSFRAMAPPLREGDVVSSSSRVTAVTHQSNGIAVEVQCDILRSHETVILITSKFLVRQPIMNPGTLLERKAIPPYQVQLKDSKDLALLLSRGFASLDSCVAPDTLLGSLVNFQLHTITQGSPGAAEPSSTRTTGSITITKGHTSEHIGEVQHEGMDATDNPVLRYLERHGTPVEKLVPLEKPIRIHAARPTVHMSPTDTYSLISGDYNPIHTSDVFASFCGLPQTIRHGMCTSAAVHAVIQKWAGGIDRVHFYEVSFLDMLAPDEDIEVELYHIGMRCGRKVISVKAFSLSSGSLVLDGTAEVQERHSAFLFTGQGSQKVGIGMDLAETSSAAREIWDRADEYLSTRFGKIPLLTSPMHLPSLGLSLIRPCCGVYRLPYQQHCP